MGATFLDFEVEYPYRGIASDSGYASNTPDSTTCINIPKLQADLDTLATLPSGSHGPIGPALTQIRGLVNQVV